MSQRVLFAMSTELNKRVITGVVGGLSLLLLILFGGWLGIFFFTTVLSLAMIFEFSEMALELQDRIEKRYALLCITWFVGVVNLLLPQLEFELLVLSFIGLFSYFVLTAWRHDDGLFLVHLKEFAFSIFGLLYLVFLPLFLPRIYETAQGIHWVLVFLFINWAGDTGAYFVGKKHGKKKLYPRISPKKTVEGALGGLASSFVITFVYKVLFFRSMPWLGVLLIPFLVGAVAQFGDFAESFVKRAFGKKDSGALLPGHGGVWDRFDGVVFSLPIMYVCVRIFGA